MAVIKGNPFLQGMTSNQAYRVNQQPRGFSSLGQQMNAQNQMGMANRKPTTPPTTPPNYRNNLLEYILSPKGQGMAQGLLEASGTSFKPVSFGEALARGMGRSTEAQRYADQIAFRDKQYQDEKAFRDQQTAFQNLMAEKTFGLETDKFGLSERKFLSDEELELKKIGLTEEQIKNAKQNNIDLLAFKDKKLTSDEKLALQGLGLQEESINNLENYRTKSLEFQDKQLTSQENISLKKLGISEQQLKPNETSIDNAWKLGMENIGLRGQEINNIAEFRSNTLALDKDKLDFSKQKFDKDTELTLKKLGLTETQINNAEKYNSERIRLEEKGLDIKKIVADANMIRANSVDNRTTKQKELDDYATLFNLDKNSDEFKEVYKQVMTKPANQITISNKAQTEKDKSEVKRIENDYTKYENAPVNKARIEQIESSLNNFRSGFMANTRALVGSAADLVGIDSVTNSDLFNPSAADSFKAASSQLQRQLASGLQNLNIEEVKMVARAYPRLVNTVEGNQLLIDIYKAEYDFQEKMLQANDQYYSDDVENDFKNYSNTRVKLLKEYQENVRSMVNETVDSLNQFDNLVTNMSKEKQTGTGIDVNGNKVDIVVEPTDQFLRLQEGMPVFIKQSGTTYKMLGE